ncbi:MAG: SOS response-associated peptidase [Alphaproteobacteria bacterium]
MLAIVTQPETTMCGRYVITTPVQAMAALFGFDGPLLNLKPRYNVAPTQGVPIIRPTPFGPTKGARELGFVRWGLVPSWAKEVATKPLINARGETVADKSAFKSAFLRRRCLVPADGFYEWRRVAGEKPAPHYIYPTDASPMALGGIWEHWLGADGSEIESMAIVTIQANRTIADLHHRMPVILDPADWALWLAGTVDEALPLIRPAPEDRLTVHAVSRAVNGVAEDSKALIRPLDGTPSAGEESALPQEGQLSLF